MTEEISRQAWRVEFLKDATKFEWADREGVWHPFLIHHDTSACLINFDRGELDIRRKPKWEPEPGKWVLVRSNENQDWVAAIFKRLSNGLYFAALKNPAGSTEYGYNFCKPIPPEDVSK